MFLRVFKILNIGVRFLNTSKSMANSRFEYVRQFEIEDKLLLNTWIIVRIDGQHFHKFSNKHQFEKPNDIRAIQLMNKAAIRVMCEFKDILIAYGQSDEYSFVLRKDTQLYNRRGSKIMTYINSLFTSSYVFHWKDYFGNQKLFYPPSFDARVVLYPTDQNLKDYLSWRQVDCHINNLYNTTFWSLVLKSGLSNAEAEQKLCGTFSSDKNEILFSEFGINYNNEPDIFKKGTTLLRKRITNPKTGKRRQVVFPLHIDMVQEKFWTTNQEILAITGPTAFDWPDDQPLPKDVLSQLHIYECTDEQLDCIKNS